ncbi:MAG: AAA family ATPase [Metamycoplasmataceae bacterium]
METLKIITNAKNKDNISHAYLFYGDFYTNVFLYAFEAIKIIIQNSNNYETISKANNIQELSYPDLVLIEPNSNDIITKMEVIDIIKKMSNSSLVNNSKKILIIKDVDKASTITLNSLLKYIEDPGENTIIIMTTNHYDNVISTIKSRAQNIFIKKNNEDFFIDEIKKNNDYKNKEKLLANSFKNLEEIKENYQEFSSCYENIFKIFNEGYQNGSFIKIQLNILINKNNYLNVLLILSKLFLEIGKKIYEKESFFPDKQDLIKKYKNDKTNYWNLIIAIDKFKEEVKKSRNFALQKEEFLIILEREING